ncbi:heterodisulfide reductase-related iron-sulfur binding cluster [Amycolatopsis antarctica]|uniref:heterodisulfide reductase-related iron-sulfur binding cluster n=1 Tax=Amycolatopsis antarctica TaxID=1854586 RepID=UPI001F0AE4C6|nr:heterodisulfide reductase-related iron-sulfur binding cluster [Amycolatopsis antarctica]
MGAVQITLGVIAVAISLVAWTMFARTIARFVRVIRLGQPDATRNGPFAPRMKTLIKEFAAHTRMNKKKSVGPWHWLVMWGFLIGSLALFEAYGEVFVPTWGWPILDDWSLWHLLMEILGVGTVVGGIALVIIRQRNHPRRADRQSRFSGSDFKAAYFVEAVVIIEGLGIVGVRAAKAAMGTHEIPTWAAFVSNPVGEILPSSPNLVSFFAFIKLMSAVVWLIVVAKNMTMGVAWHRFSAFPNIYFKREDDGTVALGKLKPMMSGGKPIDLEEADPDTDTFGAGRVEDFSWKGWLDFSTCTECGRCQEQCPAWNTGKPLSPKLLITQLRDHAYAKAPYLLAGGKKDMAGDEIGLKGETEEERHAGIDVLALAESERPLIGDADELGVIDPDMLWSCTSCGACVEQCPVDIEHVDHIVDMRRYQVMIESNFPTELNGMFKNLENKGNPWGQNAKDRMQWAEDLDFEVPVFDGSLDGAEYLFWVGCAGAFEDRAKKTTRAVAELLHMAGVGYKVLGPEETCTGDPARRAGNEFVFQMLAQQNVEVLNSVFEDTEPLQRKIVVTCAHCFNTLANEYPELGGQYEVVHHTQLLNRLVREKRLTPVAPIADDVTYHDPCYLGRHNKVYDAPRELVGASGATLREMPRHGDKSMCCGAGGARMWMEEKIGKRINVERVDEALGTAPSKIATGCPFCRVMLTDGVTARQNDGKAGENVEVVDVAQLLLASVKRKPGAPAAVASEEPEPEAPIGHTESDETEAAAKAGDAPAETAPSAEAKSQPSAAEPVTQAAVDPVEDEAATGTAAGTAPVEEAESGEDKESATANAKSESPQAESPQAEASEDAEAETTEAEASGNAEESGNADEGAAESGGEAEADGKADIPTDEEPTGTPLPDQDK